MNDKLKLFTIVWLLRCNGMLLSLAFVAIFLPAGFMASIHTWLGIGDFPNQPITIYLARSLSGFYFVHGLLGLYLAQTIYKNWDWIPLMAGSHLFLACVFFFTDLASGMPLWWTCAEGPPIAVFCIVLFYLWKTTDIQVVSQYLDVNKE